MHQIHIREIQPQDNPQVARIVREVLTEYNAPKTGTAYADPQLDQLFEVYNVARSVYFVVLNDGKVIGGAGIAPLQNGDPKVCELQKMYFLPEARGRGFGKLMMEKCLLAATEFGFEYCYLETLPSMKEALSLYRKSGFTALDAPMGGTGHTSCPVWMGKQLIIDNE
jgi:putative acetyltransferase